MSGLHSCGDLTIPDDIPKKVGGQHCNLRWCFIRVTFRRKVFGSVNHSMKRVGNRIDSKYGTRLSERFYRVTENVLSEDLTKRCIVTTWQWLFSVVNDLERVFQWSLADVSTMIQSKISTKDEEWPSDSRYDHDLPLDWHLFSIGNGGEEHLD